eukprot:16221665-Heterocapsa_arctica.AAC.1
MAARGGMFPLIAYSYLSLGPGMDTPVKPSVRANCAGVMAYKWQVIYQTLAIGVLLLTCLAMS